MKKLAEMTKEEAEKELPFKLCPVCGTECEVRKGGPKGWFKGCPNFPTCPGKLVASKQPLEEREEKPAFDKLRIALEYIRRMGGVSAAHKWLRLAGDMTWIVKDNGTKEQDDGPKSGSE